MKLLKNKYGFYTFFKDDGLYYFQFNDEAGEPILFSHGYQSEKSRDHGIQAVIRNAGDEKHYEVKGTPKEQFLFILKAGNHQEIGRSRFFASKDEMEEKLQLLKKVQKDVPVFGASSGKEEIEKPVKMEKVEKIPRYKFSIVYYPNSKVWNIVNVFTGDSIQLNTFDCQLIEAFLAEHIPSAELEKKAPKKPEGKTVETKQKKAIKEAVELKLRSVAGKELDNFVRIGQLHELEILLEGGKEIPNRAYDAKVMIKSFEDGDTLEIGNTKNQMPRNNRILIPLMDTRNLKSGMYRLTATVQQEDEKKLHNYEGDKLVMLN